MLKSTPHAHTTFVDGKSTPEETVLTALKRGFVSIGFSEHAKQRIDGKYGLCPAEELLYIEEIKRLKEKYAGRIKIYLGIERDVFSVATRLGYDYVIAASHYMVRGDDWFSVDSDLDRVREGVGALFGGNGLKMARAYYEQYAAYIEEFEPEIIAHLDLIRKNNAIGLFFDERSPEYLRIAYEAMERMISSCGILEVNTGAMARGYMETPYPDLPLLRHWRALNGRVILSSDCHDASKIDYGFDMATEWIREAGYKTAVALSANGGLFEEYEL